MILDTPEAIAMWHYHAQLSACKLQLKGMKFGRRSIIAHVKRTYGYTGRNESVVAQFDYDLHDTPHPVATMAARMDAVVRASAATYRARLATTTPPRRSA